MSNYIFLKDNSAFGGQQSVYLLRSQEIIEKTSNRILEAIQNRKDLTELFHELLGELGQQRQMIAKRAGTENWQHFGKLRFTNQTSSAMYTCLGIPRYEEYNKRVLGRLNRFYKDYFEKNEKTPSKSLKFVKCLDRQSTFELSFERIESIPERLRKVINQKKELTETLGKRFNVPADFVMQEQNITDVLKKTSPREYTRIRDFTTLETLVAASVDLLTLPGLVKVRKIDGLMKLVITGEIIVDGAPRRINFTEIHAFKHKDTNFTESTALMVHQDSFHHEPILGDIAKIFRETIEIPSENLDKIKEKSALFKYLFSHATPYERGSAAIGEWLERSLYLYHGYSMTYSDQYSPDLEALIEPFGNFWKKYNDIVKVEKKLLPN